MEGDMSECEGGDVGDDEMGGMGVGMDSGVSVFFSPSCMKGEAYNAVPLNSQTSLFGRMLPSLSRY